jgi:hypothetical protein
MGAKGVERCWLRSGKDNSELGPRNADEATRIKFHFHATCGFTRLESHGTISEIMKLRGGALRYISVPLTFRCSRAVAFTKCSGPTANSP